MTSRRVQNKMAMSSKLYLLRKLTNSKSVNNILSPPFSSLIYVAKKIFLELFSL